MFVRQLLAMVVAPCAAVVVLGVVFLALALFFNFDSSRLWWDFKRFVLRGGLVLPFGLTLMLATPANALLRWRGRNTFMMHAVIGATIGFLGFFVVYASLGVFFDDGPRDVLVVAALIVVPVTTIFITYGVVAGLATATQSAK